MSKFNPNPQYPRKETSGASQRLSFWSQMGVENILHLDMTEFYEEVTDHLYWAPVEESGLEVGTSQYRPNHEITRSDIEGEISLEAARRILSRPMRDGDSLRLRLIERSNPERFFEGNFEATTVETTSVPPNLSKQYQEGRLIATETSPEFESSQYNFVVVGYDQKGSEDLENWR